MTGHDGGVVAVLTAAGSGTRLGASGPKALVELAGRSLVARAAHGLLASGVVDHVVVTAPEEHLERFVTEMGAVTDGLGVAGAVDVVAGSSASRQASVARGLVLALALRPDADVVLVHDAARALTPPAVVRRVVEMVRAGHAAVVPALPVTDTVKEVAGALGSPGSRAGASGVDEVVGTPDRSRLRAVQTPQGFDAVTLLAAHRLGAERAEDEALAASDDAGLVEDAGGTVAVVEGDPRALKITTRLDLALAELLLARDSADGG